MTMTTRKAMLLTLVTGALLVGAAVLAFGLVLGWSRPGLVMAASAWAVMLIGWGWSNTFEEAILQRMADDSASRTEVDSEARGKQGIKEREG